MTIAEKIRQCTDAELAELLLRMHHALLEATVETDACPDVEIMEEILAGKYEEEPADAESQTVCCNEAGLRGNPEDSERGRAV